MHGMEHIQAADITPWYALLYIKSKSVPFVIDFK